MSTDYSHPPPPTHPFPKHVHAISYLCAPADLCQGLTVQDSIPVLAQMPSRHAVPHPRQTQELVSFRSVHIPVCVSLDTSSLPTCIITARSISHVVWEVPWGKCPVLDSSDAPTITCPRRRFNKDFMNEAWCVDRRLMSTCWLKG